MKTLINILKHTLAQEMRLYSEYLPIAREENQAIIMHDINSVNKCMNKKELFLAEVQEFEDKRMLITNELCEKLNLDSKISKLDQIIALIDDVQGEELNKIQVKLKGVLKQVKEINYANEILLREALENLNQTVDNALGKKVSRDEYDFAGRAHEKVEVKYSLFNLTA
ncbi:MAG: flagellar protein FlgN [bacterium]